MLSMCGLICRFFHGWRQTEAVATMRQVAILPQMSLLVERCDHIDPDRVKAIYCQPLCGIVVKKQLLWRESNKQVLTVTPKETHNLMRWTRFDSGSDDQGIVAATNAKTMLSTTTHSINEITIILEASYSSMSAENIPSNCITVSDLADLYAWKSMEAFKIIIKTTPAELVAMIHAFFTDSLFLEDNLQICRMSTVDITGIPTVKPKAADQTYTDNVKQIVHNLENQIQNAKYRSLRRYGFGSHFPSNPGSFSSSSLPRRASEGPIFHQPSTSKRVFLHSIHHASDEAKKKLQLQKSFDEELIQKDKFRHLVQFPATKFRQKSLSFGAGLQGHYYPLRIRSETDLLKATQLIRGNLANIVENYLSKLEVKVTPAPNAIVKRLSVMPQFYVPRQLPRSIDDYTICDFHRHDKCHRRKYRDASDSSPETRSESAVRSSRFIGNETDSSLSKVFAVGRDSSCAGNISPYEEFSSDSLNEADVKYDEFFARNKILSASLGDPLLATSQDQTLRAPPIDNSYFSIDDVVMDSLNYPVDEYLSCEVDDLAKSFSSDSLGSSPKSVRVNKTLSSPEDLSQKESTSLEFPSHWRDEYERIFGPANTALSKDSAYNGGTRALQSISEVYMITKTASSECDLRSYPIFASANPIDLDDRLVSAEPIGSDNTTLPIINSNSSTDLNLIDQLTGRLNQIDVVDTLDKADWLETLDRECLEENLQCNFGETLELCESSSPLYKLSPVESVTESGFASLRDSEYNNSDPISDRFIGLPVSKSRDSLDAHDLGRALEHFTEESVTGLSDSIPDSILSSSRGSVSDTALDQERIRAAFLKNSTKIQFVSACNPVIEEVLKSSSTETSINAVNSASSCDTFISVNSNLERLPLNDLDGSEVLTCCIESVPMSVTENGGGSLDDETTARFKWYLGSEIQSELVPFTTFDANREENKPIVTDCSLAETLNGNCSIDSFGVSEQAPLEMAKKATLPTEHPDEYHLASRIATEIVATPTIMNKQSLSTKLSKESLSSRDSMGPSTVSLGSIDSKRSGESSITSNNSSSSDFQDRASLRSADSSDSFPHFDSVRANPKPKRKHKKILSVAREDSGDKDGKEISREEERSKRNKKKVKKSKSKDDANAGEKKFAFKSLKELLKVNKSKDKEHKKEKNKSPSLLKRFENIGKSAILRDTGSAKRPTIVHNINDLPSSEYYENDGISDHLNRSVLGQVATENGSAINKATLRKLSHSESPGLYRKVLLKNMSSSQESIDIKSSSRFQTKDTNVPVMGTRALGSRSSFSVTIGFRPHVGKGTMSMSEGTELHRLAKCVEEPPPVVKLPPDSTRSSSMEILVCGKIKEHGKRNAAHSREGSFRLHREISVETLFEAAPAGSGVHQYGKGEETYEEFLQKVRHTSGSTSRRCSNWSLGENGSSESIPGEYGGKPRLAQKYSLPASMRLSDLAEISSSNPNLTIGSTTGRGMSLSSSFTSSPYRRYYYSSSTNASPIRRPYTATPGKSCEYLIFYSLRHY